MNESFTRRPRSNSRPVPGSRVLEAENNVLNQTVSSMEQNLRKQAQTYERRISELSNKVEQLSKELRAVPSTLQNKDAQEEKYRYESKIASLESELKSKMSSLDLNKNKAEKLESELKKAQDIIRSFSLTSKLTKSLPQQPYQARIITRSDDGAVNKIKALESELRLREEKVNNEKVQFETREREFRELIDNQREQEYRLKEHIDSLTLVIRKLEKDNKISDVDANKFIQKLKEDIKFKASSYHEEKQELEDLKDQYSREMNLLREENTQVKQAYQVLLENSEALETGAKKQRLEHGELFRNAKSKVKAVEKELALTANQLEKHEKANLQEENEDLKFKLAQLTRELKLSQKKAEDSSTLQKTVADLKEQLFDAKKMIGVYKKELDLAEKEVQQLHKKSTNDSSSNHTSVVLYEQHEKKADNLDKRCRELEERLAEEQSDKEDAYHRLNIYKEELERQEEFFKQELDGLKDAKQRANYELDDPLIEQVIDRFNLLQTTMKNERESAEKKMLKDKEMAKQKVEELENEILKAGDFYDEESKRLQLEVEGWKEENYFMARRLRGLEDTIAESNFQISQILRDQNLLEIDREQQKNVATRYKLQYEDLLKQFRIREAEWSIPPKEPRGSLPVRNSLYKPRPTEQLTTGENAIQSRANLSAVSFFNQSNTSNFKGSNDKSMGLYDQRGFDSYKGDKRPINRLFTAISDFTDENIENVPVNLLVEDIPDKLDPDAESGSEDLKPLLPFNVSDTMDFKEFCRRWRLTFRNDIERNKLLEYMMAWDTLQKEAVSTPENCSKLSTILKNSLASSKHQLNDKVVNLMNKLIPNNFFTREKILGLLPQEALSRGLIKIHDDEDQDQASQRLAAMMTFLLYMEKMEISWNQDMSLHLKDVNGVQTLISSLNSTTEWAQVQAAMVLAYITDSRELVPEINELEGINELISKLPQNNLSLKKQCARTLANILRQEETRDYFLVDKDNKAEEILSGIVTNDEGYLKYLLECVYYLSLNVVFQRKLLEDPQEYEQIIAVIEEVKPSDCKAIGYRILKNLSPNKKTKIAVYYTVGDTIGLHLQEPNLQLQSAILHTLQHLISEESQNKIDKMLLPSLVKHIKNCTDEKIMLQNIYITKLFTQRYGEEILQELFTLEVVERYLEIYRSTKNTELLQIIAEILHSFISLPKFKEEFITNVNQPLIRSFAGRLAHKEFDIRVGAALILVQLLPDVRTHRYITKSDVRNVFGLFQRDSKGGEANTGVELGLKILIHLTETDEFMELLHLEGAYRFLIKVIGDGINEQTDIDALHALHNILCSIHGKDIIAKICLMPQCEGLKSLMSLLIPPTEDNSFAVNSISIWLLLSNDQAIEPLSQALKENPDLLKKIIEIHNHPKALPKLQKAFELILTHMKSDRVLAAML